MKYIFSILVIISFISCHTAQNGVTDANIKLLPYLLTPEGDTIQKVFKTKEKWKKELGSEAYSVLRNAGTERAFTGEYWDNKKDGIYYCNACGFPLFSSETKYKSGSGWPSYYQPINDYSILEKVDYSLGSSRTEILCARCEGHLGHVFEDGPPPTGLRYCVNSISLKFEEKK